MKNPAKRIASIAAAIVTGQDEPPAADRAAERDGPGAEDEDRLRREHDAGDDEVARGVGVVQKGDQQEAEDQQRVQREEDPAQDAHVGAEPESDARQRRRGRRYRDDNGIS
jgi:hypothetical protein